MIHCKKDDEDKGSSLQNGVKLSGFRYVARGATTQPADRENRKFSGSPSGVPSPVNLSLQR